MENVQVRNRSQAVSDLLALKDQVLTRLGQIGQLDGGGHALQKSNCDIVKLNADLALSKYDCFQTLRGTLYAKDDEGIIRVLPTVEPRNKGWGDVNRARARNGARAKTHDEDSDAR
jgi:hypothetical protein